MWKKVKINNKISLYALHCIWFQRGSALHCFAYTFSKTQCYIWIFSHWGFHSNVKNQWIENFLTSQIVRFKWSVYHKSYRSKFHEDNIFFVSENVNCYKNNCFYANTIERWQKINKTANNRTYKKYILNTMTHIWAPKKSHSN